MERELIIYGNTVCSHAQQQICNFLLISPNFFTIWKIANCGLNVFQATAKLPSLKLICFKSLSLLLKHASAISICARYSLNSYTAGYQIFTLVIQPNHYTSDRRFVDRNKREETSHDLTKSQYPTTRRANHSLSTQLWFNKTSNTNAILGSVQPNQQYRTS